MATCHRGVLQNSLHTLGPTGGDRGRVLRLAHAIGHGEHIAHSWRARIPGREASAIADRAAGQSDLRGRAPRVRKKRRRCPGNVRRLAAETGRRTSRRPGRLRPVRSGAGRDDVGVRTRVGRPCRPSSRDAAAPAGTTLRARTHRSLQRAAAWRSSTLVGRSADAGSSGRSFKKMGRAPTAGVSAAAADAVEWRPAVAVPAGLAASAGGWRDALPARAPSDTDAAVEPAGKAAATSASRSARAPGSHPMSAHGPEAAVRRHGNLVR